MAPPLRAMLSSARNRSASLDCMPVRDSTNRRTCGRLSSTRLKPRLRAMIVREIELAYPGRVAAAADILEKKRVGEIGELGRRQPDLNPDVEADPTAAHAMAGGMAFGDVERVTQRTDEFRKSDAAGRYSFDLGHDGGPNAPTPSDQKVLTIEPCALCLHGPNAACLGGALRGLATGLRPARANGWRVGPRDANLDLAAVSSY